MKRFVRGFVVLGVVGAALGCTPVEVTPEDPECVQEESQVLPPEEGGDNGVPLAWQGAVLVTERRDSTAGGNPVGIVAASFYDVRSFSSQSPPSMSFTPTCVGITGQPAQTGTRTALPVSSVDVTGLAIGTVRLGGADAGLAVTGLPAVFGNTEVGVDITGADGGFFTLSLAPLAPPSTLTVTSPDLSGSGNVGTEDLLMRWTGGTGEGVVVLDMSVVRDNQRATVSCVVKDDGCHRVGGGVMTWLTAGRNDPVTVVLRRSRAQGVLVDNGFDGGAGLLMQLTSEARGRVTP